MFLLSLVSSQLRRQEVAKEKSSRTRLISSSALDKNLRISHV